MSDLEQLKQQQREFANHLRNPAIYQVSDNTIEPRRYKVYQDLIFNNILSFLTNGFPVLKSLHSDEQWRGLARAFLTEHHCHTPYFSKIAEEFIQYLQEQGSEHVNDKPWLLELAHYEYMEVVVDNADEQAESDIDFNADLFAKPLAINSASCALSYQWPVHKICNDYLPTEPEPVNLMIYRSRTEHVKFVELSSAALALLQAIEAGHSVDAFIEGNSAVFEQNPSLHDEVKNSVLQWQQLGIILGAQGHS